MAKDKILVTGGTGFIGTHLCRKLVELGQEVHSVSLSGGNIEGVNYHLADLSVREQCDRVISRIEPDFVFHLAAQPLVGIAINSPMDTFETNIRGAFNLLQALHYYGAARGVVWVSTDKVYGSYKREVKETDELLGFGHPYDVSKLCGDVLAKTFAICYSLPIAIVRSGNIYGPGDTNTDRLIPETILTTLDGDPTVIRSDGKFVRDYIYVDDIIDGYLRTLSGLLTGKLQKGDAVNFGSSVPHSVMEIVDPIIELMNRVDLVPVVENNEKHEIPYQHLDWTKAKTVLGWEPKVLMIEGLKRTISWYKENRK